MACTNGDDAEATPLLAKQQREEAVYLRFKPSQKRVVVAIASSMGLLTLFVSAAFLPSIPQLARDLHSNGTVVSWAVSLSVLAMSIGSLFSATYSAFYGRRPVYLVGAPLLFVGSLGVASARSIPQLMVWRFIQTLGVSPGIAVGSAVIGDIYKLEERGQAMGTFFAAVLMGSALGPLTGGFAVHYFSWRTLHVWTALAGLLLFFVVLYWLPETSHPGERLDTADPASLPTRRPVVLNPLKPFLLMRNANLLVVTVAGLFILMTEFALLVPMAYTIGQKYNITNEALIGACFLPSGIGNMIGAPLSGMISDRVVIHYTKLRGGVWYPEDRLRTTLIGSLIFVPLAALGSGLATGHVSGKLGLTLNLVCFFFDGIGVDFVLSPTSAYIVDMMHAQSAEATAANGGLHMIVMAFAVAGLLPMIKTHGVVATDTLAAVLAWLGFGLLWGTIRYGDRLRRLSRDQ